MLKVNNITTRYGTIEILRYLSLHVNEGEIVTLLGANGAGKTTTLRTIIGLVRPTEGNIYLEDKRIDKKKTNEIIEMGISMVMEGRGIFPDLNVLENLRMGALYEKSEEEIEKRLNKVYNLFPILNERKNQLAGTFSGGEQGMLAIGRGMMSEPKIMLLDEPSLGLAPKLVDEVFEAIKRINSEGTTILLVEQNAVKALKIASRGYVLQKGQIVIEGPTDELKESEIIKKAYLTI
ncbi:MAG: ABC transporter ATP-binding protein [Candidatus Atribacteria bacterium]